MKLKFLTISIKGNSHSKLGALSIVAGDIVKDTESRRLKKKKKEFK